MASSLSLLLLVLCGLTVAEAQLRVFNLRATGLPADIFGITDGYVKGFFSGTNLGMTSIRHNTANPWWDEEFAAFDAKENDILRLEVYDHDMIFDDLLGVCQRMVKPGTHDHDCVLEEGGTLHYTYTLA